MLLEGNGLGETFLEVVGAVIAERVWKTEIHVFDFGQGVLGSRLLHICRSRPHWDLGRDFCHGFIELLLISSVSGDLTRIDAHDDGVEVLDYLEEPVMLGYVVENHLHCNSCPPEAVCDSNRVESMTTRHLVATAHGVRIHVATNQGDTELRVRWVCDGVIFALRFVGQARHVDDRLCLLGARIQLLSRESTYLV